MDFNTLNIEEKDYLDQPILENEIDLFFSECEILLTTDKMDVLGNNDFGFSSSDLINKQNATEQQIRAELHDNISKNCFTNEFLESWDILVKFMKGTDGDIALIDIVATPFGGSETKKSFIFD